MSDTTAGAPAGNTAIDLFAEFATNANAEEAGAWVPYSGDIEFLIARSNNPTYARKLTKLFDRNRQLLNTKGKAAEEKAEQITIEVMAEAILLGWKGNFTWKGAPLPYSKENAKTVLALKDFRRWVQEKAEDFERFKLVQDEADAGN
jgi:hypothetical protein